MDNRFKSVVSQRKSDKCDKCDKQAVHDFMGSKLCKDDLASAVALAPQQLRTLENAIRDSDSESRVNFLRMKQNIKTEVPKAEKVLTGIEYEEQLEQTTASKESQVYSHCSICGAPLSRKDSIVVEQNGHWVARHKNPAMCEVAKNHPETQLTQDPQITNAYSPTISFASKEEKMAAFDEFDDEQPTVYNNRPGHHGHGGEYDPWCRACKKERTAKHATRRHAQARTIACPFCSSKNTDRPIPLEHRNAWKCAKCNGIFEHKGEMYSSVAPWLEDKILKIAVEVDEGGRIIDNKRTITPIQNAVCQSCGMGNYDSTGLCRNCGSNSSTPSTQLVASAPIQMHEVPVEFITDHEAIPFDGMPQAICQQCQEPIARHSRQGLNTQASIYQPNEVPVEFITDHHAIPSVGMKTAVCEVCKEPISRHSKQDLTSWK